MTSSQFDRCKSVFTIFVSINDLWVDLSLILATSQSDIFGSYEVATDLAGCWIIQYGLATCLYNRHHDAQNHLSPLMYNTYHRDHIWSVSLILQWTHALIVCLFFFLYFQHNVTLVVVIRCLTVKIKAAKNRRIITY